MTAPAPNESGRSRRARRLDLVARRRGLTFRRARALLAGALVLGIGATATLAAWTDQENAKATLTAGTFALESLVSGGSWTDTTAPAAAAVLPLAATGMMPGTSKAAWIQIRTKAGSGAGTVNLTGVTLATTPADPTVDPNKSFGDALTVRIGTVATTGDCVPSWTGGSLVTKVSTLPTGLTPATVGANSALVAIYCVVVTLPTNAANTAQGGSVTPTWAFTGTSS
ncbi:MULTISPECIES: SipW-dependent-type signal peptide-containing protein [unclassified Leucobacter]|uniref:SipW-dependent-type signal peptide-containing protein n=1 Tax=unclassified Leucobacter TaxID=2621730 RepID=UPI00069A5C9E|nr:SipW-dependent-type signal peptide-containing protein [Leucobacter sp. Ag1]